MAKKGRKKKEILEADDLSVFNHYQGVYQRNIDEIGEENLTDVQRKFLDDVFIRDGDDEFTRIQKMYKFKHIVLGKPLSHDECTYLVDINDKGLKPSATRRLSRMRICTLEASARAKLKEALATKYGVTSLREFMISGEDRSMPAKPINSKEY